MDRRVRCVCRYFAEELNEDGVVQYDVIGFCHRVLFVETGIFISHEQVQRWSSLGTHCSSSSAPLLAWSFFTFSLPFGVRIV